jgi:hypothetical protein
MSNEPLTHLMIDLETLGKRQNSVVLSLACVPFIFENHQYFSEYVNNGFHVKFNIKEQMSAYKRCFEKSVVDWWKDQNPEAVKRSFTPNENDVKLRDGIIDLYKFISETGFSYKNSYIFSRRSNFDFPILEHLIEDSLGLSLPYNTWNIRDSVTYIDIFAGTNNGQYDLQLGTKSEGLISHYALHDAALEAARLNELYYIAANNLED